MVLEQIHELSNSISKTPMTCFVPPCILASVLEHMQVSNLNTKTQMNFFWFAHTCIVPWFCEYLWTCLVNFLTGKKITGYISQSINCRTSLPHHIFCSSASCQEAWFGVNGGLFLPKEWTCHMLVSCWNSKLQTLLVTIQQNMVLPPAVGPWLMTFVT